MTARRTMRHVLGAAALAAGLAGVAGCAGLPVGDRVEAAPAGPAPAGPDQAGPGAAGPGAAAGSGSVPAADPALRAFVEAIDPVLRAQYPASYAGLEVDEAAGLVTIWRVPDAALDATVRARAGTVRVQLRDARYPQVELLRLVDRVMADAGYWQARGIRITAAAPQVDGSGVVVMTADGAAGEQQQLAARYGADRITVRREDIRLLPAPSSTR